MSEGNREAEEESVEILKGLESSIIETEAAFIFDINGNVIFALRRESKWSKGSGTTPRTDPILKA
jgi:hypothetical protein